MISGVTGRDEVVRHAVPRLCHYVADMRPLVLWGGTGQAIVLNEFAAHAGCEVVVIVDRNQQLVSPLAGIPVVHSLEELSGFIRENEISGACFSVAIGGDGGEDRCLLSAELKTIGLEPLTAIHPRACVSDTASCGEGIQVMANATVVTAAVIGDYAIINTGAIVDHECRLGQGVHVGPGATLAGLVDVGEYAFIGAGAVVLPRIRIGTRAIVGAGSVVTSDVPDNVVCMGVPARITGQKNG